MSLKQKRLIILLIVIVAGAVLGRLAVRALLSVLLGGTLFGGNFLFDENKEAAAGLFSVMAGRWIEPDLFGTPEYDEVIKDISAVLWVDEDTVPTLIAYGVVLEIISSDIISAPSEASVHREANHESQIHDTMQPYKASVRLDAKLTECGVPHDYIVMEHSGHGLQNNDAEYIKYMRKVGEYLETYMPVE